ncbi:NAD(P)/FAD-dependent oxidoreductase [Luteolibacter flavescens]|uniref:NAD(P)/FAD-dependent oxidoreductase n=1 Tax=Luteolibacter flavescens TaxID=1859460 RepID=A0ABT3FS34_9BACT|nr:NAD(P)/FAD-dependent oxidoreductase [Luteolibacter flavescens]MCW1886009.1 NAD(P)/FAD-dependent oxidoreductase [Luteolibacter flavescens]
MIVIGAGLGGISAAISLSQQGYRVSIFEKNGQIGGKLNVLRRDGYTFDLGPSILTLPYIFERLFERSGKRMEDYISIQPVRPHWRNFFEDGISIDLHPDPEVMGVEATKAGEDPAAVKRFLEYSGRLFDLVDEGYFQEGLDTAKDFSRHYGFLQFTKFDFFRTMHGGVKRHLKTAKMRAIFDYFIKYVGSSAYRAPAFMNCLPAIQFRHDLWYVPGGLYGIATGLGKLMGELGIEVAVDSPVREIRRDGDRVTGVVTGDGVLHPADIVVSNMEVIPAYQQLLGEDDAFMKSLERYEPSCSGLVLELGLDTTYPQLAHHNFFFSADQKQHFRSVFKKRRLPDDPTIYLVAASRSDPSVAPPGCDTLKILPHIPYIDDANPLGPDDYAAFKERVLDKLERMGLHDLRRRVVVEHLWTPHDIREQYNSNKGSIYGVVSDRFKNFSFKAPKQSTRYPNLFFVGGSVNPGGGMPMVVQCGQNVSDKIVEWDRN